MTFQAPIVKISFSVCLSLNKFEKTGDFKFTTSFTLLPLMLKDQILNHQRKIYLQATDAQERRDSLAVVWGEVLPKAQQSRGKCSINFLQLFKT